MSQNNNGMGAWDFWRYDLLWGLPVIGTFFLIKHANDYSNMVRRDYARSKFIPFLIWGVVMVGLVIFALVIYGINGWTID